MAIHPIVVMIFQFEPKWWTDQQTDIANPRVMTLEWL